MVSHELCRRQSSVPIVVAVVAAPMVAAASALVVFITLLTTTAVSAAMVVERLVDRRVDGRIGALTPDPLVDRHPEFGAALGCPHPQTNLFVVGELHSRAVVARVDGSRGWDRRATPLIDPSAFTV